MVFSRESSGIIKTVMFDMEQRNRAHLSPQPIKNAAKVTIVADLIIIIIEILYYGLYEVILNCIYGFLWMRQWLFYNDTAVRGLPYRRT